jgi:hypothetical protein
VISFTSNLSSLLLNNATCTSIYGDCYVVGNRIVINVANPTSNLAFTITKSGCSASLSVNLACSVSGWVVVKFADHAYTS